MTTQSKILLVTSRPAQLKNFAEVFYQEQKMNVLQVKGAKDAIFAVKEKTPLLVIVDDQIHGVSGLDLVRRLIEENAFIHTAAISELTDEEFHNRSEGLGILSKLPLVPGKDDARKLIRQLEQVASDLA